MRYPLPWFPLSDDPMRCISRTIRDCRPYRSSHVGCRFYCNGSSRFVGDFRRLRWSSCIPVPRGRSCRIVSVGNDSVVFAVVEHPFFTEVVAAFKHFAVGEGGFGRGRLKNRIRVRAYRTHSMSGLKVFSGLQLAYP